MLVPHAPRRTPRGAAAPRLPGAMSRGRARPRSAPHGDLARRVDTPWARGDTRPMISTVAVGLDGSATASKAVDMAAELARRFDAELVLLSVYKKGDPAPVDGDAELDFARPPRRAPGRDDRAHRAPPEGGGRPLLDPHGRGQPGRRAGAARRGLPAPTSSSSATRAWSTGSWAACPTHVTHKAGCSVLVVKTTSAPPARSNRILTTPLHTALAAPTRVGMRECALMQGGRR